MNYNVGLNLVGKNVACSKANNKIAKANVSHYLTKPAMGDTFQSAKSENVSAIKKVFSKALKANDSKSNPTTLTVGGYFPNVMDFSLADKSGAEIARAYVSKFPLKNYCKDNVLEITIASTEQNKGYGKKLIDAVKEKFKGFEIMAMVHDDKYFSSKHPHKFFIDNGFVPSDKNQEKMLKEWIASGAKQDKFPKDCEFTLMTLKP